MPISFTGLGWVLALLWQPWANGEFGTLEEESPCRSGEDGVLTDEFKPGAVYRQRYLALRRKAV
jgi:hypothetical protein